MSLVQRESKSPQKCGVSKVKKVLLIGVDGCRADALQLAKSSGFDSIAAHSYLSYHCDRGPYTVSGPGWSTILHGVWPDKHKVFDNDFLNHDYGSYRDVFFYLREEKPNLSLAVVANWPLFLKITSSEDDADRAKSDELVKLKAIHMLRKFTPDVMLLHFNDVDHAGHTSGFDPNNKKYIQAIRKVGKHADDIMKVIEEREKEFCEEWLVIVCTDHGGYKLGHGGQDELENTRYVFSIFRTPGQQQKMLENARTVDILPTILKYLGVNAREEWNLDGKSIL